MTSIEATPQFRAPFGICGKLNPRGIPEVTFIDDVEDFVKNAKKELPTVTTEVLIKSFNTMYSKYKLMEVHLLKNKGHMKNKIPDLRSTLDMVHQLIKKRDAGEIMKTKFNLADNVYADAEVEGNGTVCLWMGANVMLEFTYEEAVDLLEKNLAEATRKLKEFNEDLDFLKDQITTAEVSMARVYNHDVKVRRQERDATEANA